MPYDDSSKYSNMVYFTFENVYITSKGVFRDKLEAEKKANRNKLPQSRPDDVVEYEKVETSLAIYRHGKYYLLNQVQVS